MSGAAEPRRTIEDLVVLHSVLQPELRDVYLEGRRDTRLLRWYFHESGIEVTGVYAIDDRAQVPSELVHSAGGEVGARGRVIGLASAMTELGDDFRGVTCVIDRDRDCLSPGPEYPHLLRTDFGSMEGYLFQARPFSKLLELGLGQHVDADSLIERMMPALNELFLIRAALHVHGPNVRLVSRFMQCCEVRRDGLVVDSAELVARSLAAEGLSSQRERVVAKLDGLRQALPEDRMQAVRGHDIAPVLAATLGLGNDLARPDVLERIWLPCVHPEDLDPLPLFEALRERLT